jgi:hypothetical protein
MAGKSEKRGSLRGLINALVKGKVQNKFFFSISQNISASGILLETDRILKHGDKITCSFVLQHEITAHGEIVRTSQKTSNLYNYGVHFINLDPKSKAEIEEVLNGQTKH